MLPGASNLSGSEKLSSIAAGWCIVAVVLPALMTIALLLALHGGPVLVTRRCQLRGRIVEVLEFNCPGGLLGDILWQTRLNQIPVVLNCARGELLLGTETLDLLEDAR